MKFFEAIRLLEEDKKIHIELPLPEKDDPDVRHVFSDSRKVLPGSIFCCIDGENSDGHD